MDIKNELRKYAKSDKIEEKFAYFHKTGKGDYAENDIFIGVTVPDIRKIANEHYKKMPRTMLRYGIEKFDEDLRQDFLKGRI